MIFFYTLADASTHIQRLVLICSFGSPSGSRHFRAFLSSELCLNARSSAQTCFFVREALLSERKQSAEGCVCSWEGRREWGPPGPSGARCLNPLSESCHFSTWIPIVFICENKQVPKISLLRVVAPYMWRGREQQRAASWLQ